MADSALEGLRVLDLSRHVSGGYCGKVLACYGADVVKVEPPRVGDPTRRAGSFRGSRPSPEAGALFLHLNTGKRDITLDLEDGEGRDVLRRLVRSADVLIEDAGPGVMDEKGLGYREISAENEEVIYVSLSPFGSDGPYAGYQATQLSLYALGGYMYLTGDPDREPLQGPGRQPAYLAGAHAVAGALLALWARDAGAGGQLVEVSEMESVAAAHQWTITRYNYAGMIQRRLGNRYDFGHPNTIYACRDGHVAVGVATEEQAERFFLLMGRPDLQADDRFSNGLTRLANADALDEIVRPWFAERTKEEIVSLCQELRVPCSPASEVDELLENEQLRAREFWREVGHPQSGRLRYPGPPFRMSSTPGAVRRAPLLGEHNDEVYSGWLGCSPVEAPRRRERASSRRKLPVQATLDGVRILDLTRVWAGPLATRILADFGAEVIRVENRAARGPSRIPQDYASRSGFYPDGEPGERPWNRNGFLNKMNRNKLSLTLELNTQAGADLFCRLVALSDLVVENYSPRVMANFGLDYERLREAKPDLIMVSMPGYGMTGPYRDRVAYGTTLEPEAGLSSLMGYRDRGPQRLGVAYPDPVAGIHAAGAILMALWCRRRTGRGQHIDLAQIETAAGVIGEAFLAYQLTGARPERLGNRHPEMAPHGCYPCRGEDRWLTLAVRDDREWAALCVVLGRQDLADEPRFANVEGRLRHHDELDRHICAWTRTRDATQAMRLLQTAGIPAGAVLDARDLATNEHLEARGFYPRLTHPDAGTHPYPGQPIRLSATPSAFRTDAPPLGEHNEPILRGLLGLSENEYQSLIEEGVVGDRPPT